MSKKMHTKAVVFDLDGTLAESKQSIDPEMAELLCRLMRVRAVCAISGCSFKQFEKQILESLDCPPEELSNLFLFPVTATAFYRHDGSEWREVYAERLTADEKGRIAIAVKAGEAAIEPYVGEVYGEKLEDRLTQMTYSGIGQHAPIEPKKAWDPDQAKRKRMVEAMRPLLPDFEVNIAGLTSIDITRKGVDKGYGIKKIEGLLGIGVEDTKALIRGILAKELKAELAPA